MGTIFTAIRNAVSPGEVSIFHSDEWTYQVNGTIGTAVFFIVFDDGNDLVMAKSLNPGFLTFEAVFQQ